MPEGFAEWLGAQAARGRDVAIRTALAAFEREGWRRRTPAPVTLLLGERSYTVRPGEPLVAGRVPDNAIGVPEDLKASRRHCELRVDEHGLLRVKDLATVNGTYVDYRLVRGEAFAFPGDSILLGTTTLRVAGERPPLGFDALDLLAAWRECPCDRHAKAIEAASSRVRGKVAERARDLAERRRALAATAVALGALLEPPTIGGLALLRGPSGPLRVAVADEGRALPAAMPEPPPGDLQVDGLAVLGELAAGAWGRLHAALDARGRLVLVEELPPSAAARLSDLRARFPLEKLADPNAERVLAIREPGVIVRELARGVDLASWLAAERPREERVRLALALVAALEHAHALSVLHGDIHARRILVDEDSGEPVLGGFGRAFALGAPAPAAEKDVSDLEALAREVVPELEGGGEPLRERLGRLVG